MARRSGPRPGGPVRSSGSGPRRFAGRLGRLAALLALAGLAVAAAPAPPASSPEGLPLEYQVKAAFLYQFLNFVDWPAPVMAASRDTMVVGVLGETPMTAALQSLTAKPIRGRQLVVRPLRDVRELRDSAALHVLFVAHAERDRAAGPLRAVRGASVLTVGESEGFARLGGVINFVIVDGKVGFEINPRAAEEANLRISSKLLRLARIVEDRG